MPYPDKYPRLGGMCALTVLELGKWRCPWDCQAENECWVNLKNNGFDSVLTWPCGNHLLIFCFWWYDLEELTEIEIFLLKSCVWQRLNFQPKNHNKIMTTEEYQPALSNYPLVSRNLSLWLMSACIEMNSWRGSAFLSLQCYQDPILLCRELSNVRCYQELSELFCVETWSGRGWNMPSSSHAVQCASCQPIQGQKGRLVVRSSNKQHVA